MQEEPMAGCAPRLYSAHGSLWKYQSSVARISFNTIPRIPMSTQTFEGGPDTSKLEILKTFVNNQDCMGGTIKCA